MNSAGTPIELAWYGCDLRTGGIVGDLLSLKPTGALSRKLGDATPLQFELNLAGAPTDWEAATAPGRSVFVAVDVATDMPPLPAGLPLCAIMFFETEQDRQEFAELFSGDEGVHVRDL